MDNSEFHFDKLETSLPLPINPEPEINYVVADKELVEKIKKDTEISLLEYPDKEISKVMKKVGIAQVAI